MHSHLLPFCNITVSAHMKFNPAVAALLFLPWLAGAQTYHTEQQTSEKARKAFYEGQAQAKIGKLVIAGPLVKAGHRRGLIGYRVSTMAEAMERASADPMVKAGRMKPELYEWKVPKGILK